MEIKMYLKFSLSLKRQPVKQYCQIIQINYYKNLNKIQQIHTNIKSLTISTNRTQPKQHHSLLNSLIMQSSKQNPNQKTIIKQSMQSIKKTIVPFNQELLNLQKKIQEVESKNELILQKIHKAYDFKKTKNRVFYDASQEEEDDQGGAEQEMMRGRQVMGSMPFRRNIGEMVMEGRQQPQTREFQIQSARKQLFRPPIPTLQLSNRLPQQQLHYPQQLQYQSPPSSGHTSDLPEQQNPHQVSYQYPQQANQQLDDQQSSQQEEQDLKSHSNYSDIQQRKRITENFKKREQDFSDIKSNFDERRNLMQEREDRRGKKHTPRKSFVFSSVQNNSSYSEGNLPNKDDIMQNDDLQMIESPVTTNPTYFTKSRSPPPNPRDSISVPSQQPRNVQIYSTNQLFTPGSYMLAHNNNTSMASVPNIPLQSMQMLGQSARQPYHQQPMSQNEINYLSDMYKAEREKTLTLQKQLQQRDENIQHLKMYKKSFRRFRDHTFHLFEEAFDQYVETFLRNRLYKIEKAMRKNQNRLAALMMQVKDFKEERVYNLSLRKSYPEKINKRSYSSLQPAANTVRTNFFQQRAQQQAFEQNTSTISNRSGQQRSVSARKQRRSQDKSLTKKSNNSHIMMKKEFTNIAENYQQMIKVKNEQIERFEGELKQVKETILLLEEENNRLKLVNQQTQTQLQNLQMQNQLTGSAVESEGRRNSGNLRILSRSSSRSEIKKGPSNFAMVQENDQLLQKIKTYTKQIQKLSEQNSSLQNQLQSIHSQHLSQQQEMKQMAERIFQYEQKIVPLKDEKIVGMEGNIARLTKDCEGFAERNGELSREMEMLRGKLGEKDKKILELDSALSLKNSEIKKVENLLTLKTYKLQQFNKLLLPPASNQPLNDSISSIIDQPHNKTTFLMLQNLQKQLQQQKHQKQLEFLKLKRSYQSKIEQLKIEFEQIVLQNEKLADKLHSMSIKEKRVEEERNEMIEGNQKLREEVDKLQKEVAFLEEKVNFYQVERQTGRTGSFGDGVAKKKSDQVNQHPTESQNLNYMKPLALQQQDFDDFPSIEESELIKRKQKSISSWKPVSGQIQLLDESSYNTSYNGKKSPSEENHVELKRAGSLNQNIQHKLSTIKDENIELSQKVAKLEKENKFLKETETQLAQKYEELKSQLAKFAGKYDQLEKNNQELIKMVEEMEKEKNEMEKILRQHQTNTNLPVELKQIQKHIQPVELKGSGYYSPWSFAEKEDMLLQKSSKDLDIRDSIVSGFNLMIHPPRDSRQSIDKKVDELTKKLAETELLLQNKEKINEDLVIGFTKKIDKLTGQIEEQAKEQGKVIEKYIQENFKLRKQKQKLEQEIESLNSQLAKQKSLIKPTENQKKITQQKDQQNLLISSEHAQQIDLDANIQTHQDDNNNLDMLQQRIQGFNGNGLMLGINNDYDDLQVEEPQIKQSSLKEKVRFAAILEEQEDDAGFEDFQEQSEKISLLQKQVKDLEETIEQLQKFLEESLNKVKLKEEEKFSLVEELQRKNNQVEELRDLLQLKQAGKSHTLTLSKSINYGRPQRDSIEKSQRSRLNSITSLKYSRTNNQCERKSSFDQEEINFDFLDQTQNNKSILDHSHMYSENMSMIFEKEENFLEQVRKAKNKRKEEGKLLRKTFEYIKKLRGSLNQKNKKIKILEMRVQELKDNCWLWKKGDGKGDNQQPNNSSAIHQRHQSSHSQLDNNPSGIHPSTHAQPQPHDNSYIDPHNQTFNSQQHPNKLVDSRLFQCNSQDLNKKKPHRHNHYKKLEYDTKLIVEENKILTKQIQMLQEELLKIEEQENGLMAVKELYKEEIRALNKQNQQLTAMYQCQVLKLQQKLQSSQGVHNFQAIKQLFKKIIDNVGVILYPTTSQQSKKKTANQLKQEKRKQAEQCIKVICSILNYQDHIRNQLCLRLCGQGQQQ